jgi:hypothetical protein
MGPDPAMDVRTLFHTLMPFCSAGVAAVVATREPVPAELAARRVSLIAGRLTA